LVFLFVLMFAWQHFQCVREGYELEQFKSERADLEEQNHLLRLERAALADPERIDTLARTQLGMVSPGPEQVIRLDEVALAEVALEGPELARNTATGSADLFFRSAVLPDPDRKAADLENRSALPVSP
jgi:cell division protein FtsL